MNTNRLDPVDTPCRHHDYAYSFYAAWGIGSLGAANACIVRAGAEKGRLTDASGAAVPYDLSNPSTLHSDFDSMLETGAALYYYWYWGTEGCWDPGNFLDATASKR